MMYFLHKLPVLTQFLFFKWKNESLAFREGSLLTGCPLVKTKRGSNLHQWDTFHIAGEKSRKCRDNSFTMPKRPMVTRDKARYLVQNERGLMYFKIKQVHKPAQEQKHAS